MERIFKSMAKREPWECRRMKALPILSFFLVLGVGPTWAANDTYVKTLAGKSCKEGTSQQIECTYKIGKDLKITISGIGEATTGVNFDKSNIDGDYWASFGMLHLCVIVKPGRLSDDFALYDDIAFISPKNGKVYRDWVKCQRTD